MAGADIQRRRGPAPGATREEVLARVRETFLACERIDVQAIAAGCGVGRATLYRWFGSRDRLIGEAMLGVVAQRVADARRLVGGHGAAALARTFDLVYRGLISAPHVRFFIDADRQTALPVMTSSRGALHPQIVAALKEMIDAEVTAGHYEPLTDSGTLAYVLVRLTEGMLFNHDEDDLPKDLDRMREVAGALIGVDPVTVF